MGLAGANPIRHRGASGEKLYPIDIMGQMEYRAAETICSRYHSLRQSLLSQQSPRSFGTAEKPRKRGLLQTKLLTATIARNAVLVSLSPVVSKAPDFAILVRNFKRLILNGYSVREIRTFRIPLVGASGAQIETRR